MRTLQVTDGVLEWLAEASDEQVAALMKRIPKPEIAHWPYDWKVWGRKSQQAPPGDWWVWLVMAGRGFGKTRLGAEWVRKIAESNPDARIALVGASLHEARSVMVEGESGLLSIGEPWMRPAFESSVRRVVWPNGAQAFLYSAGEPESLRGPQHSHAWCDEIAKWDNSSNRAMAMWDNLLMGLRLGDDTRLVATTTPRPVPLVARVLSDGADVVVTRGSTFDNARNLPARFVAAMQRSFGGTTLGRQELLGEMIEDLAGALWSRSLIEASREEAAPPCTRVVVGVDPPASAHGDACGIVVCGIGDDRIARVLADCSVEQASPERWARAVANAACAWSADRVVAEANQGGDMVGAVLRAAQATLPLRLVHASRGKTARAEPVAALYEAGRVAETFIWALPQVSRDGFTRLPAASGDDTMQSFDDVLFPLALGRDASVTPEFSTNVTITASGFERRNSLWSDARMRFDVGPGVRSDAELGELIGFFRARRGQARGFLLRDPSDFSSNGMTGTPTPSDQVIGNGDGAVSRFALVKHYGDSADAQRRRITRPRSESLRVSINGAEIGDFTVEPLGIIALTAAPPLGSTIRAGFVFDVPVRFAEDSINISGAEFAAGEAPSVPLVELREDA